jgi:hypothetical protein
MSDELAPAKVTVVGAVSVSPGPIKERPSTMLTRPAQVGNPLMLLGHAPSRCRAVITVVAAVATDSAYLASSSGDAMAGSGAVINAASTPFVITSTDEVWLIGNVITGVFNVGVIQEFES